MWLLQVLAKSLLFLYSQIFSPALHLWAGASGGCRLQPGCGAYASQALELHGPIRGSWLSLKRIFRCHPFARAGDDPVPHAIAKKDSTII